jgi:hypothetical protein
LINGQQGETLDSTLFESVVTLAHGRLLGPNVTPKEHAILIATVALWSLRERGVIKLSSWERERWWWPWSTQRVLMVTVVADQDIGLSLEQQFLTEAKSVAARPHAGPNSMVRVRDVVYNWVSKDYPDPYRVLVRRVEEMATRTGWYAAVLSPRRNPVTRFLFGPKVIQCPIPFRADAIRGRAESLVADWYRFRHDEDDLSSWLIETVTDAIRRRELDDPEV